MDDFLADRLDFLPRVNSCCFCINDLKIASILCSVLWLLWDILFGMVRPSLMDYRNPGVLGLLQAILALVIALIALVAFIGWIMFMVSLCTGPIGPTGPLLYIFAGLAMLAFCLLFLIISIVRAFVAPGSSPVCTPGYLKSHHMSRAACEQEQGLKNMAALVFNIPFMLLSVYFYIVVHSYIRRTMENPDD